MKTFAVPLVKQLGTEDLVPMLGTNYMPIDGRFGYVKAFAVAADYIDNLKRIKPSIQGFAVYTGNIQSNRLWFVTTDKGITKTNEDLLFTY